jgi:hypothetical protein
VAIYQVYMKSLGVFTDTTQEVFESNPTGERRIVYTTRDAAPSDGPPVATDREQFEAWFSQKGCFPKDVERSGEGYKEENATRSWFAWQAAHATPADHSRDSVDAARWRWLLGEHFPTAENPPLAQVLWKQSNNRHGHWVNMIDGNDLKAHVDAAIESKPAEQSQTPIPGSPAYSLRGLYVPVDKYFVDGKPVTPEEYIAWQSRIIEAITKSKVPDPKYYGGSTEEGDQHEVKCAYVDGWNECRAAIESEPAEQSLWQPIETAPKTGRTLLLGYPNSLGNWRTVRGEWLTQEYIDQNWEEPDEAEAGWYETSVEADDVPSCWPIAPTHWQPLPKPPADAAIESQRGDGESS